MGELQQIRHKNYPPFDEIWLIANNSKSFVNRTLFRTFKNIAMGLMVNY